MIAILLDACGPLVGPMCIAASCGTARKGRSMGRKRGQRIRPQSPLGADGALITMEPDGDELSVRSHDTEIVRECFSATPRRAIADY